MLLPLVTFLTHYFLAFHKECYFPLSEAHGTFALKLTCSELLTAYMTHTEMLTSLLSRRITAWITPHIVS